ncbi:MAG: hypothetical protein PHC83_09045 [Bacteroidales bacterium]|nr:hypothetical protein [Bacteroidales bacterium]
MNKIFKKQNVKLFAVIAPLFIYALTSCTTTKMTISTQSLNSAVANVDSAITSLSDDYQLTGSGSETKNEIKVTGQSYSTYSGYGTRMDNDFAIYDNYTYTDSTGNTIEFQLKHKITKDYYDKEYVYGIEVVKCNCMDKKNYSRICGDNGIVKKVEQLTPDQKSVFPDKGKTTLVGVLGGLVLGGLLSLILFL